MTRPIDADAFRKWLCALFAGSGTHEDDTKEEEEWNAILARIITHLDEAPTVEERPHGKWIFKYDNPLISTGYWECSKCKKGRLMVEENYCPNCGADMRKEGEAE